MQLSCIQNRNISHRRIWVSSLNSDHSLSDTQANAKVPVVGQVYEVGVIVAYDSDDDTPICSGTQGIRGSVTHSNLNLKKQGGQAIYTFAKSRSQKNGLPL